MKKVKFRDLYKHWKNTFTLLIPKVSKTNKSSYHQILLNMQLQQSAVSQMVGENQRKMSLSYTDSHTFHNGAHQSCNSNQRAHKNLLNSHHLNITFWTSYVQCNQFPVHCCICTGMYTVKKGVMLNNGLVSGNLCFEILWPCCRYVALQCCVAKQHPVFLLIGEA